MAPFVIGKSLGSRTRTRCFQRAFLLLLLPLPLALSPFSFALLLLLSLSFLPFSPTFRLPRIRIFLSRENENALGYLGGTSEGFLRQMEAWNLFISMRYLGTSPHRNDGFPPASFELWRSAARETVDSLVRRILQRTETRRTIGPWSPEPRRDKIESVRFSTTVSNDPAAISHRYSRWERGFHIEHRCIRITRWFLKIDERAGIARTRRIRIPHLVFMVLVRRERTGRKEIVGVTQA